MQLYSGDLDNSLLPSKKNANVLSDIGDSTTKPLGVKILNKKALRQRRDRSELLKKEDPSFTVPPNPQEE